MTDLDMMTLAAKVVGIEIVRSRLHDPVMCDLLIKAPPGSAQVLIAWNPRDDDGDSRRLEVALQIHHRQYRGLCRAGDYIEACDGVKINVREPVEQDPCKAARMAVLRVAVEIAKVTS